MGTGKQMAPSLTWTRIREMKRFALIESSTISSVGRLGVHALAPLSLPQEGELPSAG